MHFAYGRLSSWVQTEQSLILKWSDTTLTMPDILQAKIRSKYSVFRSRILPADKTVCGFAIAQTMGAIAGGIYFSSSALFFSRASGLAPLEIGLGLTISGVVGLLVPLPFGILADRWSARNIAAWLTVGVGLSYWLFLLVNGLTAFIIATCCFAACLRGAMTARMAMIGSLIDASHRTQTSAYLHALGNGGLSVGALIGSLALYFDSLLAYQLAFAIGGAIFLVAALVYRSLPAKAPGLAPIRQGATLAVLRDRPYVVLALLNTIILLYIPLLNMTLPLYDATFMDRLAYQSSSLDRSRSLWGEHHRCHAAASSIGAGCRDSQGCAQVDFFCDTSIIRRLSRIRRDGHVIDSMARCTARRLRCAAPRIW
ncbi:MFS transporter [Phyllobacterium meliloti]|uniref:MFS transporter n=1 Tax=Phyllobacterium meliloti TaxID=555317 RepID=UPI001D14852E|nr:MFS transporter [Phyllobacterium sp. T1293]UGX88865.1 MFS transporter [Phyllobacterium sp. T1293]